jgi:hypothetical protein
MDTVNDTIRDLFVISVILVLVAYATGTTAVISSGATALVNTIRASTGQNPSGTGFNAYPSGTVTTNR